MDLWLGPTVFQPQPPAQALEAPGAVAGTVVGEHPSKADTQAGVITHGLEQGQASVPARFVRVKAAEGHPRMIDPYRLFRELSPNLVDGDQAALLSD